MNSANAPGSSDHWTWAAYGRCQGSASLFYNEEEEPRSVRREKERLAKQICQECPVIAECRRHAAVARELYGVWGGQTEMERHTLAGRARTG